MKTDTPTSIKILYNFVSLLYWVMILITILMIVEYLSYLLGLDISLISNITFWVRRDIVELNSVLINGIDLPASVSGLKIAIEYKYLDKTFILLYSLFGMLTLLLQIFTISRVRRLIKNVMNNLVFVTTNVNNLKTSAYSLLLIWFMQITLLNFIKHWYIGDLIYFNLDLVGILFSNFLVAGLILLFVAFIFQRGVFLQSDQEPTI